jgi:hypothetical protein
VGPRAGLDGRKISPPPGFNPRTVQPLVIPTELPGPHMLLTILLQINRLQVESYFAYTERGKGVPIWAHCFSGFVLYRQSSYSRLHINFWNVKFIEALARWSK